VAEHEERALRRVLGERVADESRSRAIIWENRLEVTLKNERALALHEKGSALLHDPSQSFADERRVLTKVLSDDGGLARRPGMVAGVCKTSQALEKDLQLEEVLDLSFDDKAGQPGLPGLRVFAPQTAGVPQQDIVCVALFRSVLDGQKGHAPILRRVSGVHTPNLVRFGAVPYKVAQEKNTSCRRYLDSLDAYGSVHPVRFLREQTNGLLS
jgi:hypothetical protein